jgi:transglutaminase-like putative cysteine protease
MRPLTLARLLVAALWAATGPLWAAEVIPATDPTWVLPAERPAADERMLAAAVGGRVFLVVDDQIAWDGATRIHYARRAVQVTDRSGLEASASVDWDFAPEFDSLGLTRLQVIRDGKITDLTATLHPDLLRRESRLEAGILDGSLTAHYTIPDLRVGDVVDYSFIQSDRPVVPGASFSGEQGLEYDQPVVLSRLILNWPAQKPLYLGELPERVVHNETALGGVIRHEWTRHGHIPPPAEEMTPIEALPDAAVRYSADADWGPLVAALLPLYPDVQALPPEWQDKVQAIRDGSPDDLSRATAALRMVQDEIRYVGIEIGAGGVVPRKPVQVVAQGFGDCKDKSVLLRTMLGALGIEAHVALTDLDEGHALALQQPGLSVMDHMIVQARIGGKVYWMDPTGSHEGGRLDHAAVPDYGYALPIAKGVTALDPIEVPVERAWNTQGTEEFDFSISGVAVTVTSEFRGAAANAQRYRMATEPAESISRDLVSYYATRYPGIGQAGPVQVDDDMVLNRLTTVEHYHLPAAAMQANGLWQNFVVAAEDFGRYFPQSLSGTRQTPLTAGLPKMHHHTVLIRNAPVPFLPPDRIEIRNEAFAYSLSARVERMGGLRLDWDFRTLERVVPADRVAEVVRDARKVSDSTSLTWDVSD